jgi:hypothetical protein
VVKSLKRKEILLEKYKKKKNYNEEKYLHESNTEKIQRTTPLYDNVIQIWIMMYFNQTARKMTTTKRKLNDTATTQATASLIFQRQRHERLCTRNVHKNFSINQSSLWPDLYTDDRLSS